jgi:hypothetical protein
MDTLNRWQDRTEIVLGIWLCVAPWLLHLPQPAAWCAIVVGVFVILMSLEDSFLPNQIEEWANTVLGVGLMISPWAWGYADDTRATLNALITGLLVSGFAFWGLERLFIRQEEKQKIKHT